MGLLDGLGAGVDDDVGDEVPDGVTADVGETVLVAVGFGRGAWVFFTCVTTGAGATGTA